MNLNQALFFKSLNYFLLLNKIIVALLRILSMFMVSII